MPSLNSSAISYVDYDWNSRRLYIRFRFGRTYTFYRVPPYIYDGLVNATSPGTYYRFYIWKRYGP